MAIYLDLAVVLNLLVDFLLLLAAQRMAGFSGGTLRLWAAAGLGGLYSGLCLLPGLRLLGSLPFRCLMLLGMGAAAYGISPAGIRRTGCFLLLSLALGGMAVGLSRGSFPLLILEAGLLLMLCRLAFGEGIGRKTYVPVTLRRENRTVHLNALVDTGNSLRDPVTGEPVLVVDPVSGEILTGLKEDQLCHPVKTLCENPIPGLRLVPCTTVGGSTMLLAIRIQDAVIGSRRGPALVAFASEGLGRGRMYEALTGGSL